MKWDVILGITSSIGLFHALLLIVYLTWSKKGDRAANLLLAATLTCFSLRIFKSTFYAVAGFTPSFLPILGLIAMSFNGPLVYFYFAILQRRTVSGKDVFHLLIVLFAMTSIFVESGSYVRWSYLVVIITQFGYISYMLVKARSVADRNLREWLYTLAGGFLVIEVVYLLQWTQLEQTSYIFVTLVSSIVLVVVNCAGLVKYDIIKKLHHYRLLKPSTLPTDTVRSRLRKIIVADEGYRDCSLSVKKLSDMLSVSQSRISGSIQDEFNMSFPDLINQLRLDYVIAQFQEATDMEKLETLAYDAGFKSPSNFYAHFKRVFKTTPTAYRERVRSGFAR